jgi:AraC-like DNA-binding protein
MNNQENNQKESNLKRKLREFIDEIKNYITNNHLTDDKFLKNLCDDIYISYSTLGSKYGKMYTCARQTSQGTQRCYNVTETPNMRTTHIIQPVLRRQVAYDTSIYNENMGDNENMDNELFHEVSNFADTPYTTPQATQLMEAISGNIWDDDDEDEDEDDDSVLTQEL